jgi:hypothetical protein
MAIKINNTTVVDDSRNFIGVGLTVTGAISVGSTTGTTGQVLQSTGVGVTWVTSTSGGSGEFNTGITSTSQLYPLSYDTTVFTFPSTSGKRYIIESINVANISDGERNIIASLNYNLNGEKVYFAYNIPMVSGGSVELLKQPHIANPSDYITMWTNDETYYGRNNAVEVYMTYTEVNDTNYFGVGVSTTIPAVSLVGIFTSTTYPSVIQSIHLTNRTDNGDYPISVQITNGSSSSYLVKNMVIPRYATVEICDRPKRIAINGVIKVELEESSSIDISISGKKITG